MFAPNTTPFGLNNGLTLDAGNKTLFALKPHYETVNPDKLYQRRCSEYMQTFTKEDGHSYCNEEPHLAVMQSRLVGDQLEVHYSRPQGLTVGRHYGSDHQTLGVIRRPILLSLSEDNTPRTSPSGHQKLPTS